MTAAQKLRRRFWSKVSKGSGCWLWTAGVDTGGYGTFRIGSDIQKAHRVAWRLSGRRLSGSEWLLHKCDVRRCVRPKHCYIGDEKQNARDAVERHRLNSGNACGELNGMAKLTWARVEHIKTRYADVETMARDAGVSVASVLNVLKGVTWRRLHIVPERLAVQRQSSGGRGEFNGHAKLETADVRSIRQRCASGERQAAVARDYGIDQSAVSNIVRRRNWAHVE